jgi:hypothetical protein
LSIQWNARKRKWEVRWREGGRQRSRLFDRKGDARAFERDLDRRRQLGALALGVIHSKITLAEFVAEDWWPRHAIPNLAEDTRRRYLEIWGTRRLTVSAAMRCAPLPRCSSRIFATT